MMKCFFILLANFLLFFVSHSEAQNRGEKVSRDRLPRKILVKWAPLNLLDPVYPALQLGVEFYLKDRWSLEQSLGGCLNCNRKGTATHMLPYVDALKIRTQGRYYLKKDRKELLGGSYFGGEVYYVWGQYQREAFFVENEGGDNCFDSFGVNRRAMGGNILYGYQLITKRGFVLDAFGGVGLRQERVNHSDRICPGVIESTPDCLFCGLHDAKNQWRPAVVLGVKVGWGW